MTLEALPLLFSFALTASDWPRFRGPNGTGVSSESGLPEKVGREEGVQWAVEAPGGNSSPIVVDGRVFLTGHEGDARLVVAYDSGTGKVLWRRSFEAAREETFNPMNGPATPTPVSDGKSVFVFFPELGLLCLSLGGEELWRVPLGPFGAVQGLASSPLHVDGRIVLLIDTPTDAYVTAFDAATGRPVWRTERPTGVLGSYATPTSYASAGRTEVIVAGAVELTGYDAATGERIWWAQGVSSFPAAPPFVDGDSVYTVESEGGVEWPPFEEPLKLFDRNQDRRIEPTETAQDSIWARSLLGIDGNVGNGDSVVTEDEYRSANGAEDDGGLVRTRVGGKGNVRQSHVVWRQTRGVPFLSGAILYQGSLYLVRSAVVSAYDPDTGELLRQHRLKDALGDYYASPVAGDGKIYFASLEGVVTVLKAGAEGEVLSSADLGERIIATPALAHGGLLVRTERKLYRFSGGGAGSPLSARSRGFRW